MSHIFTAEGLGRDFLSKSLGLSAARAPPSLLHNGAVTHANLTSQVISFVIYLLHWGFFVMFYSSWVSSLLFTKCSLKLFHINQYFMCIGAFSILTADVL